MQPEGEKRESDEGTVGGRQHERRGGDVRSDHDSRRGPCLSRSETRKCAAKMEFTGGGNHSNNQSEERSSVRQTSSLQEGTKVERLTLTIVSRQVKPKHSTGMHDRCEVGGSGFVGAGWVSVCVLVVVSSFDECRRIAPSRKTVVARCSHGAFAWDIASLGRTDVQI